MACRIKNWERFQHYKNRRPPWIKLYRELLDDPQYFALPDKAAKYLPLIWLIASDANGSLPAITPLSFRLRMTEKETNGLLSALSHWVEQDASTVLADCKQSATPEQEGEGEREREKEPPLPPKGGIAGFEKFWKEYPKKVGKGAAEKSWLKIKPLNGLVEKIIMAVISQRRSDQWTKDGGQYIPHPSTWLNQRRWEDELGSGESKSISKFQRLNELST